MAVLIDQTGNSTATELTPSQFLKRNSSGPYTSLVVRGRREVIGWKLHIRRLAAALQPCSRSKDSAGNSADLKQSSGPRLSSHLEELILPKVRLATERLAEAGNSDPDASVVVLLEEGKGRTCPVTALIHASGCTWPVATLDRPCTAILFPRGPRRQASVKHSAWATERVPLEASLKEGTEGVLCEPDGRILEGFVSNIFVVREDGSVQTAHPSRDQVLDGVVRQLALNALQSLGIPLLEEAPSMAESSLWTEAFLTNCRRMLQPIDRFDVAKGFKHHSHWRCQLPAPGPVAASLYNRLQAVQVKDSLFLS